MKLGQGEFMKPQVSIHKEKNQMGYYLFLILFHPSFVCIIQAKGRMIKKNNIDLMFCNDHHIFY